MEKALLQVVRERWPEVGGQIDRGTVLVWQRPEDIWGAGAQDGDHWFLCAPGRAVSLPAEPAAAIAWAIADAADVPDGVEAVVCLQRVPCNGTWVDYMYIYPSPPKDELVCRARRYVAQQCAAARSELMAQLGYGWDSGD